VNILAWCLLSLASISWANRCGAQLVELSKDGQLTPTFVTVWLGIVAAEAWAFFHLWTLR